MPAYDFRCRACGAVFEKTQSMDDANPACECGGATDKAYLAPPKAHFQGGGWAKDNYASVKPQMTVNQMIDRGSK